MGPHIQPHVSTLLQCLPSLWRDSSLDNSSLVRIGILTTLTNIVHGLGELSVQLHDFILPVVHLATDISTVGVCVCVCVCVCVSDYFVH